MENQVYHIQKLSANELNNCKEKGNNYAERYIKEIQDTYKQKDIIIKEHITNYYIYKENLTNNIGMKQLLYFWKRNIMQILQEKVFLLKCI